MATHLKIVILTFLLLPMIFMEEVNPVMLEEKEALRQRTRRMENCMRKLKERMDEQEETIKALNECQG